MENADEMFLRLGYTRIVRSKTICIYSTGFEQIILRDNKAESFVVKRLIHPERPRLNLLADEVLACAQLINEMRKEKE